MEKVLINQEVLVDAISFAAKMHKGQPRKGTEIPYIVHPMEAAAIVATMTTDPEVISAAILHDVNEDAKVPMKTLRRKFSERVCALIEEESEDKRDGQSEKETWMIRKIETIDKLDKASLDAKIIALGDKLSNIRAIQNDYDKLGEKLWDKFNQNDPAKQGWYYTNLIDKLCNLDKHNAFKEYKEKVLQVFSKYDDRIKLVEEEENKIREAEVAKKSGYICTVIYGSQEHDYDDDLSIFGIDKGGNVDPKMKEI